MLESSIKIQGGNDNIEKKGNESNEDLILQETYPSIFQIIEFYFFTLILFFLIFILYWNMFD